MNNMDPKALRSRIENINTLATIPAVLKKLIVVIQNPNVSLSEISKFILSDPVLTTKVLRMVNSPIYGFPGRISSVNQAVILLGLTVVKGLLFGVSVFDLMQKAMIGLWEHSLGCAITSRLIAKKKGLKEPEEASIYGLLHDIGKVILIVQFSSDYQKAMADAEEKGLVVYDTERDHFAADHTTVGAWVAQKWSFPRNLTEIIEYHHKPHLAKNIPLETAIVHVADILLRGRGFGFAGDHKVPAVNDTAWQLLNLSDSDLRDILKEMEDSLEATEGLSL
jgi:putative nucleotidyltransferase with HDIG domain